MCSSIDSIIGGGAIMSPRPNSFFKNGDVPITDVAVATDHDHALLFSTPGPNRTSSDFDFMSEMAAEVQG